jgi:dienelactone hydrolase
MQRTAALGSALFLVLFLSAAAALRAEGREERILRYTHGGDTFEGTVVWEAGEEDRRPGLLMVPNWLGPTPAARAKAARLAGDDYVVLVVDLYGVGVRPANAEEAGQAAGVLRADRALLRARMRAAEEAFRSAEDLPLAGDPFSAVGFCFGGGAVLEYARSGAPLAAVGSFHGDLASPTLAEDSDRIRARLMVLHGADDPFVPPEEVEAWVEVMRETEVDWQLIEFSNTVHSFTDPQAALPGRAEYQPRSARRAFAYWDDFLEESYDEAD